MQIVLEAFPWLGSDSVNVCILRFLNEFFFSSCKAVRLWKSFCQSEDVGVNPLPSWSVRAGIRFSLSGLPFSGKGWCWGWGHHYKTWPQFLQQQQHFLIHNVSWMQDKNRVFLCNNDTPVRFRWDEGKLLHLASHVPTQPEGEKNAWILICSVLVLFLLVWLEGMVAQRNAVNGNGTSVTSDFF